MEKMPYEVTIRRGGVEEVDVILEHETEKAFLISRSVGVLASSIKTWIPKSKTDIYLDQNNKILVIAIPGWLNIN